MDEQNAALCNEYYSLAEEYLSLKKYDKALSLYEKAGVNPDLYWASTLKMARIYVFQSKWDKAVESYNILLLRDPENFSIKESLAYVNAMKGNREKALELYDELLSVYPENETYLTNYISILCTMIEIEPEVSEEESKKITQELPTFIPVIQDESMEFENQLDDPEVEDAEPEVQIDKEVQEKAKEKLNRLKENYPENKNIQAFEEIILR